MMRIIKHFVLFITICAFAACKHSHQVTKIAGENIHITDSLPKTKSIESFITPYRSRINQTLDSVLAYNPQNLTKNDTPLNTALGNLMADVVYEAIEPIYLKRIGNHVDFVLLNHGGIRSGFNKGGVTARTAYELMPFENTISVLELSRSKMDSLINFLVVGQRAHPFSKELRLSLFKDGTLKDVSIHGLPLDSLKSFKIATSDYLANLGDQMNFFEDPISRVDIDYLIRNIFIDYFRKVDTISASYDHRFIME
ncbi:5'-nucleotidase C-terminal domain-containing protein [Ascidiimonas sp. W6]|uniref:5'-nucleotidase C-terminal domain-containing protein n=1 Tax=Ascidiimonas meishanensis TaxID=3128903 RepID=UPI0030EBC985